MKKDEDILKNFEHRIRMNEIVICKIVEFLLTDERMKC